MLEVVGNSIPLGEEGNYAPNWMHCPFCGKWPVIYPQNPGKVFHPGVVTDKDCILAGRGLGEVTDKEALRLWHRRTG